MKVCWGEKKLSPHLMKDFYYAHRCSEKGVAGCGIQYFIFD